MKQTEEKWEKLLSPENAKIKIEKDLTWCVSNGKHCLAVIGSEGEQGEAIAQLISAAPDTLKQLQECQDIIKIMLDNNIGRGSLLGKVYLSNVFNDNEKAILKAIRLNYYNTNTISSR